MYPLYWIAVKRVHIVLVNTGFYVFEKIYVLLLSQVDT